MVEVMCAFDPSNAILVFSLFWMYDIPPTLIIQTPNAVNPSQSYLQNHSKPLHFWKDCAQL